MVSSNSILVRVLGHFFKSLYCKGFRRKVCLTGYKLKKIICTIIAQPAELFKTQQIDLPIFLLSYPKEKVRVVEIFFIIFMVVCKILYNKCLPFSFILLRQFKNAMFIKKPRIKHYRNMNFFCHCSN